MIAFNDINGAFEVTTEIIRVSLEKEYGSYKVDVKATDKRIGKSQSILMSEMEIRRLALDFDLVVDENYGGLEGKPVIGKCQDESLVRIYALKKRLDGI